MASGSVAPHSNYCTQAFPLAFALLVFASKSEPFLFCFVGKIVKADFFFFFKLNSDVKKGFIWMECNKNAGFNQFGSV